MKKKEKVDFNKDYLKEVKRDAFLKENEHLKEIVDLCQVWDNANKAEPKQENPKK